MDPQSQFCHNPDRTTRGQLGLGNISVHRRKECRYRCSTCGRTFAATRDTPFYRLKKHVDPVTLVITLLCHGCPVQAIVAAFGLDERTVADCRDRAGRHAQQVHEHRVLRGQVELGHVQADELYVKAVAQRLWMAMAMAVPSRLWLGGVVSARRELTPIMAVVGMVRRAAKSLGLLVCVDGLASYVTAFTRVSRDPARTGRRGRPRLKAIPGLLLGQVIGHHSGRRLVDVTRRVVRGTAEASASVLSATGTGTGINTSYIERLNATSRASMCPLVRRGRAIARGEGVLSGFGWTWWDVRTTSAGSMTSCGSPPSREVGSSERTGHRRWRRA
jgi:transposase-like protein